MLMTIMIYVLSLLLCVAVVIGIIKWLNIDLIKMLYITTFSIFFPLVIQFGGKDAMTTGSLSILILFVLYIFSSLKSGNKLFVGYDASVLILILFGAIANKVAIDSGYVASEDVGAVIRQYFSFATSLLLFIIVKNTLLNLEPQETARSVHTEKLFAFIMALTAAHVLISVASRYIPPVTSLFSIFYSIDSDALFADGQDRITSFVFSYENYGEMLAALCPLVVYKMVTTKKAVWSLCLAIFTCGVLLSVTRSGIMLFAVALALSFVYQFRNDPVKAFGFMGFLIALVLGVVTVDPQLFSDLMDRFSTAESAYTTGASLFDTINRGNFPDIWDEVTADLTLFGHSMLRIDFHNLFLTTLHQIGILGVMLFFAVLCFPLFLLLKSFFDKESGSAKGLVFGCLLYMILFLVNEMKVEFTRTDSYSQICWEIIALCYLASLHGSQKKVA